MKKISIYLFVLFTAITLTTSCNKDDDMSTLKLNISDLENLGSNYAYEGWLIVDGNPVSTGTFTVDNNGKMSKSNFEIKSDDLEMATTFVLTIEPSPDNDPAPSEVHILGGDFSNGSASLTISHGAALSTDFGSSSGIFLLATPSDGADSNEKSGLWFLDPSSGSPKKGLSLPSLPSGWIYEGWAVINGTPVSTGTFSASDMADNSAPYSGSAPTPPFPGEDFLKNAPSGLTFPTDLRGGMAVISVEPVPDNSASPFAIKPLVGMIDQNAMDHTPYHMGQNSSFPKGTASR